MAEEGKNKGQESKNDVLETMGLFAEGVKECTSDTAISIIQYDREDKPICTLTGTFTEIFGRLKETEGEEFPKYYYRVAVLSQNTMRERGNAEYFGVQITCLGGFKFNIPETLNRYLNRSIKEYAKGIDQDFLYLLVRYVNYIHKIKRLENNTAEKMEEQINKLKKRYRKLVEVKDLSQYREKEGIYILVLDEYHVCYVGQSYDIKKRIMRHWSRQDYFSGTGIDMFKAYDTTRIFVLECSGRRVNINEHHMIDLIDSPYTLNCMTGGDAQYHIDNDLPVAKSQESEEMKESENIFLNLLQPLFEAKEIAENFIVK